MSRKVGQIIARGERRWLVRVYLGRDRETRKRTYHNRTRRRLQMEAANLRALCFVYVWPSLRLATPCASLFNEEIA